jgi:hypothetical protein
MLEEAELRLKSSDNELIEKDDQIANMRSKLAKDSLEENQLIASIKEAREKKKAIVAMCEKTNKAMNNLDRFLDYLRQI